MIQQSTAKTKRFLKAINKAAMQKCNDIAEQIEQTTKAEMQRAEDEARRDGHARIENAKAKIMAAAKAEVAEFEKEKKSEICQKRLSYQTMVFDAAKEKLKAFTAGEAYPAFLEKSIKSLEDKVGTNLTILIANGDNAAKTAAQNAFKTATIEESEEIQIGGIKVLDLENGLVFDDTLDSRMDEQLDWFLLHSNLKVDF